MFQQAGSAVTVTALTAYECLMQAGFKLATGSTNVVAIKPLAKANTTVTMENGSQLLFFIWNICFNCAASTPDSTAAQRHFVKTEYRSN
jgi:hypothetical protein